jgi:hypothetical protein
MYDIEIEVQESKYRRTYIGGSKKKEDEIFLKVQGTKEDNSDCDWLEYRRLLKTYRDDILLVFDSWKGFFLRESYAFLICSLIFIKIHILFMICMGVAILLQLVYHLIKRKEKNKIKHFNMCEAVLLNEIKKATGLNLEKL